MELVEIDREDDVVLRFRGEIIATSDSRDHALPGGDTSRWNQQILYRTDKGKYVIDSVGRSSRPGEREIHRATICKTPADVKAAIRRRNALTYTAKDLLERAAAADPAFESVLIEEI